MEDENETSEERINFIPCLQFVKRGAAKRIPEKVKLNPEELKALIGKTKEEIDELQNQEEEENEQDTGNDENDENDDIDKKYGLDNYDDENETEKNLDIGELVVFADPKDDPYLLHPEIDEDESDVEDLEIKDSDNLILVGHIEGDSAILEVYVYNDVEGDLYIHHDIYLPSPPLALEWLSYEPEATHRGSLVAIGSMSPIIDVWDLDLIDSLEPAFSLGRKGKSKKGVPRIGHSKAVLSLAWNHHVEHVLASGSADAKVLLWDLSKGEIASSISAHMELVQSLQWHPFEAQSLLTGSSDHHARVFDCRTEDVCKSWSVEGEVEKVVWNHFNPFTFYVATNIGYVTYFDIRKDKTPVWTLQAHSQGINGLSLSTQCPDVLVSVSSDKTLKVWDVAQNTPIHIEERNMGLGQIHSLASCPDAPFVFSLGGDKASDNLKIFDIREMSSVRKHFGKRELKNPLGMSDWGYSNADEADVQDEKMDLTSGALESLTIQSKNNIGGQGGGGGAGGKFRKKKKK